MLKEIISTLFGKKNQENAVVARGTEWMYGAVESRPEFDEVPTYVWVPELPVW